MTARQFAVLQHLAEVGWDLQANISSRVFGAARTAACPRALTMLRGLGLVEKQTRKFSGHANLTLTGWAITDAGEAHLVAENLRLLKELT